MGPATSTAKSSRPGLVRRCAAGAWHVGAGFGFVVRHPRLWPLAALPVVLAFVLMTVGATAAIYAGPRVASTFAPAPGDAPVWIEIPIGLLLWTATVGFGIFLGLGIALLLTAPLLDLLSRRVEALTRGRVGDAGRGLRWEMLESLRGALYFLAAAPGVLLLGLIPLLGPALSALWGARAVAFQMTDSALTRRGFNFASKRRWHRQWRFETEGFGLAGMVVLFVPFANFLLGPALVTGGTLLVLELERLEARPSEQAGPDAAGALTG